MTPSDPAGPKEATPRRAVIDPDAFVPDDRPRCAWAQGPWNIPYHDAEWGRPVHDDRTLFDTVSAFDPSDLAKMLISATDRAVSERLLWVMTRARQHEVSRIIRSNPEIDPLETEDIARRFMRLLKSIKSGATIPPARLSI